MSRSNTIKNGSHIMDITIYAVLGILCLLTLYPMYYVLILSISSPQEVATMNVYIWPKGLYLESYKMIMANSQMWVAYGYTIFYVISGTLLMIFTSVICAYPLTVKNLFARKFLVVFILIPMYFGGGLIPTYLLMVKLGLYNNIWAMIIPGSVGIWNIILTKTFFSSIPGALRESAQIDGANHFKVLRHIYLPISKPILAVISIYTIVGIWNSWFNAMVYLPNEKLQPLQMYLRRVLVEQSVDLTKLTSLDAEVAVKKMLSNIQMRYSMIIFVTLPIIFAYPFFQKYFIKGVMLGSLKE